MRLWIVGKHGLLSQAFQRILTSQGIPYIATSRTEVDVRDLDSIRLFLHTETVTHCINCSGYTAVDAAETAPDEAFQLNSIAPALLSTLPLPLVHFSTDYVFDGTSSSYGESAPASPLNVYGQTKRDGEVAVLKKKDGLVIRLSWLFGREGTHFVSTMARLLKERERLSIVSDQRGRPTYADDVVHVTLKLLEQRERGLYHFANHGVVSWYEFAEAIQVCLGTRCELSPIDTSGYGAPAPRPKQSVLMTEKIEGATGYVPPDWRARLKEVLS